MDLEALAEVVEQARGYVTACEKEIGDVPRELWRRSIERRVLELEGRRVAGPVERSRVRHRVVTRAAPIGELLMRLRALGPGGARKRRATRRRRVVTKDPIKLLEMEIGDLARSGADPARLERLQSEIAAKRFERNGGPLGVSQPAKIGGV